MPLRCIDGSNDLQSFDLSDDEWNLLRKEYRQHDLRMICCSSKAIPCENWLGTRWFRHKDKINENTQTCNSQPESREHLLAKQIIARAIKLAGWQATSEFRGASPDGNEWQADILAEQGLQKLIFEVQWSHQIAEDTILRQNRYLDSNIQCLWLFRQNRFSSSKKHPSFQLIPRYDDNKKIINFEVSIQVKADSGDNVGQNISLEKFVISVLNGNLIWESRDGKLSELMTPGMNIPIEFQLTRNRCRKCGNEGSGIKFKLSFKLNQLIPGQQDIDILYLRISDIPDIFQKIMPSSFKERALKIGYPKVQPNHRCRMHEDEYSSVYSENIIYEATPEVLNAVIAVSHQSELYKSLNSFKPQWRLWNRAITFSQTNCGGYKNIFGDRVDTAE